MTVGVTGVSVLSQSRFLQNLSWIGIGVIVVVVVVFTPFFAFGSER